MLHFFYIADKKYDGAEGIQFNVNIIFRTDDISYIYALLNLFLHDRLIKALNYKDVSQQLQWFSNRCNRSFCDYTFTPSGTKLGPEVYFRAKNQIPISYQKTTSNTRQKLIDNSTYMVSNIIQPCSIFGINNLLLLWNFHFYRSQSNLNRKHNHQFILLRSLPHENIHLLIRLM